MPKKASFTFFLGLRVWLSFYKRYRLLYLKHYLVDIRSPVRFQRHNFDDNAATGQEFNPLFLVY